MSKTIILPSCDDGNRGDQALVWQTREVAMAAGLADECKMLTDNIDASPQSSALGIGLLMPILRHPSTKFSPKSNMNYGKLLFLVWGLISLIDGFRCFLLLFKPMRILLAGLLSEQERRTIKEIRTADACFVKGGGFIHTTDSVSDPYKAFFFLYHVMLAQSLGTPVFVMPNSFGPLKGVLYQWIVRRALNRCELVTSRESISQDMLAAIGVDSEVYPDLAFGLESVQPETPYLKDIQDQHPDRPLVGITARPYRFPGSSNPGAAYSRYLNEMVAFAKFIFEKGYFPVFIEHVVSAGEHESDIAAIKSITDNLATGEFAIFEDPTLNARQIKAVYGECNYVVGTRFHSVIFALSEGTPAIAIGYGGNKGQGIMKDIGMPENVVSIENFKSEDVAKKFDTLVSRADLNEKIQLIVQESADKHQDLVEHVKKRMQSFKRS